MTKTDSALQVSEEQRLSQFKQEALIYKNQLFAYLCFEQVSRTPRDYQPEPGMAWQGEENPPCDIRTAVKTGTLLNFKYESMERTRDPLVNLLMPGWVISLPNSYDWNSGEPRKDSWGLFYRLDPADYQIAHAISGRGIMLWDEKLPTTFLSTSLTESLMLSKKRKGTTTSASALIFGTCEVVDAFGFEVSMGINSTASLYQALKEESKSPEDLATRIKEIPTKFFKERILDRFGVEKPRGYATSIW